MTMYSGRNSVMRNLIVLAMAMAAIGFGLSIAGMSLTIANLPTDTSIPIKDGGDYTPSIPSANEVHTQFIFLYQASLNGNVAEMECAATWLHSNATWVFEEAKDTGDDIPIMPGPDLTVEEIKETLETLQSGWDTKTLDELKDEFEINAQLVDNVVNQLATGIQTSETEIQMAIRTIWAQQGLGQRIIALEEL